MNILLINHYAGSPHLGMEFRPYYFAKEWTKLGHNVRIIASSYSHLRKLQPEIERDFQKDIIDEIEYLWIKTIRYKSSSIKRILSILLFITKLRLKYRSIVDLFPPDIVIASSTYPLDIYPSYIISRKYNAKLVFELHDLWPLSPMVIGKYSKNHPYIWILQRAENFSCKKCDCYISLLGNAKEYLIQHGLAPEKFHHIPNGFSKSDRDVGNSIMPNEHVALLSKLRKESKFIIGYVGGHAPSNALKSFVDSASHFVDDLRVAFVLIGDGSERDRLILKSKEMGLKNIYFLPSVLKSTIPSLLLYFDILFAGGVSSKLHYYGTSFNKITDYMLAKKPIVFAVDDPNSMIEKVGCGIRVEAENEYELTKAIKQFLDLSESQRADIGERGYKYAIKNLNNKHLAIQFLNAVNRV